MSKYISFQDWINNSTDEELHEAEVTVKKRFKLFLLLSLIPGLNIFLTGVAIFCYNNYKIIHSRGASNGSNFVRFLLLIWGFILFPLIEVQLFAHITALGSKVIGL